MSNDTRLTWKIKTQVSRFAGRLSKGWPKPKRRLLGEMLYGIQAAQDVKLSNIARSLNEDIALIKTENRLSRQMAQSDLTAPINHWVCNHGASFIERDTVLAVDLGDIAKKYGKKMEHLTQVRDGSEKTMGPGYWLCAIVGAHPYGDKVTPMYCELYSHVAPDFGSENTRILSAIHMVKEATGGLGIYAMDIGGDRHRIIIPLLDQGLRFIVRQRGDRHVVLPSGKVHPVEEAARWCRATSKRVIEVEREGHRERRELLVGAMEVRLPGRPQDRLWLVVIRGLTDHPIMLLTNVAPEPDRDYPVWISDCYLTRWKCEESYRFIKQAYQLEDVRVRSYNALRNIVAMVFAVFYFVSAVLGRRAKLNILFQQVCAKAQRFYEIAAFYQYALADGIHRLLFGARGRAQPPPAPPDSGQLLIDFAGTA